MKTNTEEEPETQLLPIEQEELSKAAVLSELREICDRQVESLIKRTVGANDIKAVLNLEAIQGLTGVRIYNTRGILVLTVRYVFAKDIYHMVGIDIGDTSAGSPAAAICQALTSDITLRRAIPSALRAYECAAALYRYKD